MKELQIGLRQRGIDKTDAEIKNMLHDAREELANARVHITDNATKGTKH